MGQLNDWAKSKSGFLKLEDNESVKCVYNGFKIVPSRFEQDQETVQYLLTVDGQEKLFESKASSVAQSFDKLIEGDGVLIGRNGVGSKTKYVISKLEKETVGKQEVEGASTESSIAEVQKEKEKTEIKAEEKVDEKEIPF